MNLPEFLRNGIQKCVGFFYTVNSDRTSRSLVVLFKKMCLDDVDLHMPISDLSFLNQVTTIDHWDKSMLQNRRWRDLVHYKSL